MKRSASVRMLSICDIIHGHAASPRGCPPSHRLTFLLARPTFSLSLSLSESGRKRMAPRGGNEKKESGRAKKADNANKKKEAEEADRVRLHCLLILLAVTLTLGY